jgi:signal transduction histidine kinase
MDELITALLSLSRITRAELIRREMNISHVAEELAAEYRRVSAWEIEFDIQPGMTAYADERLMTAVLDNLIGNAVKFSKNEPAPKVQVGMSNGNFFVRDNGVGFDPTHAGKLFKPFERLHSANEFPGTGIGLATVLRIISRHGGEMWAESEPGNGATFFFHLPDPAGTLST